MTKTVGLRFKACGSGKECNSIMEIGKVPENVLKRAVFKQIKHLRPEVLLHPGVGEDCSAIETAEDEVLVFSTDPITGASN